MDLPRSIFIQSQPKESDKQDFTGFVSAVPSGIWAQDVLTRVDGAKLDPPISFVSSGAAAGGTWKVWTRGVGCDMAGFATWVVRWSIKRQGFHRPLAHEV